MDTLNIAIIGECMVELQRQHNDIRQGFGGDTLNTAVYLARQLPRGRGGGAALLHQAVLGAAVLGGVCPDPSVRRDPGRLPDQTPGQGRAGLRHHRLIAGAGGDIGGHDWRGDVSEKQTGRQHHQADEPTPLSVPP